MAKPTAVTENGGAKVLLLADSTATTPAAKTPSAVVTAASGEATYPVGWMGLATHGDGDAIGTPGGFTTSKQPLCAVGGSDGTNAKICRVATTTPGASDVGFVVRNIPSGTQTVSGTVTANQGGSWSVTLLTGAATVGAVGVNAGTNVIGAVKDGGWDIASAAVQRGLQIGISNTTENTLLSADASNLYNVRDISVDVFLGTTPPTTASYLSFRHGVAGTEFMRVYVGSTSNGNFTKFVNFVMPDRGALNQAVTVQLNQALGTNYQYSVTVHAYKTAT